MDRSPARRSLKALLTALAVAVLAVVGALVWKAAAVSPAAEAAVAAEGDAAGLALSGTGVAVVELFTSQGCSSCPPADRLLSEIAADPTLRDRVFALSFHVDYWNRLGWRDPFSSPRWSERQRQYAGRLDASVYTPQVVVNGRTEGVGSRRGVVLGQIRQALATVPAVELELVIEPGAAASGRVVAAVTARWRAGRTADASRPPAGGEIWAALWQDGRSTAVTRGENADRELVNDRVVRRLKKVGTLPAGGGDAGGQVALDLDGSWGESDLGVVAFVQDPRTLEIFGAASAPVL